ncbi:MAG TPA: M48 family metallopeptidase [Paraburkholderia sp.]|uniref:M48 family metallopeptidase n=1 Tax=Paraburkholderia sp. TaxID=1926495 RepID=UPI002D089DBD|nr:M48 family metallopeptidase [Paraburkholderia sp.]HTR09114.1 M48 family metallopeptidase [Paraburkholderia sp.]
MIGVGLILWIVIVKLITSKWDEPKDGMIVRIYVAYGVAFFLFSLYVGAAYRARAFGNMILLGPSQFPELHAMVVEGAREIGLEQAPKTFLYNSQGVFNAFARRMLGGQYVFLTSALVDATSDEQVRFVIGHELGHHAAGHLNPWLNFIKLPAKFVPFLGSAYSRSREYTCDSVGAYLANDFKASRSALQMLGCGCRRLNQSMNCEAFMAQEQQVPPIFGFLTEITNSHPRLTRRVAAIRAGTRAGAVQGISIDEREPAFRSM